MRTNGDLVRVPQGSVVILEGNDEVLSITVEPEYAIVVDNKYSSKHEEGVKILMNNKVVYANKRNLQLVGDK